MIRILNEGTQISIDDYLDKRINFPNPFSDFDIKEYPNGDFNDSRWIVRNIDDITSYRNIKVNGSESSKYALVKYYLTYSRYPDDCVVECEFGNNLASLKKDAKYYTSKKHLEDKIKESSDRTGYSIDEIITRTDWFRDGAYGAVIIDIKKWELVFYSHYDYGHEIWKIRNNKSSLKIESSEDDYDPKDSGKVSNSIQYNGCEIRYDDTGDWYISIPQGGDKMPKFVAGFSTEEDAQEYIDTHVKKSERWVKIEPDEPEDQEELGESYDIEPDPEQRKIFRRTLNKVLDDNNCNNSIGAYDRFIRQMRNAWEGTGHDEEYLYNVMSRALKSYKPTR